MPDEAKAPRGRGITGKDLAAIAGLVLFVAGAGWVYRPLAPILAGMAIFLYAYVTSRGAKQ